MQQGTVAFLAENLPGATQRQLRSAQNGMGKGLHFAVRSMSASVSASSNKVQPWGPTTTRAPRKQKPKHSPGTISVRKLHRLSCPLPRGRVRPGSARHAPTPAEALCQGSQSRQGVPHQVELLASTRRQKRTRTTQKVSPVCHPLHSGCIGFRVEMNKSGCGSRS